MGASGIMYGKYFPDQAKLKGALAYYQGLWKVEEDPDQSLSSFSSLEGIAKIITPYLDDGNK